MGRVSRAQLLALPVRSNGVDRWIATGYLFPQLPAVYAVGNPARSRESDLFAAVLYAGPGAALTGLTAALWRGLVKWREAPAIELITPRHHQSLAADAPGNHLGIPIAVRHRAEVERRPYHGIPTVPIAQIALGLAASGDLQLVRFMLAQLDFMRILNVPVLERACGQGVPGTAILRQAIASPQPLLARARSPLEVTFVVNLEQTNTPLPELNVKVVQDITADAVWRDQMVVVELDGEGNHGTWRQHKRDARNGMILRQHGFVVIRYTDELVADPWAMHADLMPILDERRGRAAQLAA